MSEWVEDRLLPGFEAKTLAFPDDYDGRVVLAGQAKVHAGLEIGCSVLTMHLDEDRSRLPGKQSPFSRIFEVDGILTGPSGRSADVRSVWIIRATEDSPRFVTAFPR